MNLDEYYNGVFASGERFSLALSRWFSHDHEYDGLSFDSLETSSFVNLTRFVTGSNQGGVGFDPGMLCFFDETQNLWFPMVNVYYERISRKDPRLVVAHDSGMRLHNFNIVHQMMVDELGYQEVWGDGKVGYTIQESCMERLYRISSPVIKFHVLMMLIRRIVADFSGVVTMMGFRSLPGSERVSRQNAHRLDIESLRRCADEGRGEFQYALALRYLTGKEVEKDTMLGLNMLKKAAEQGHVCAQYRLGQLYDCGSDGVPADSKQAFKWYMKAADQGLGSAQNCIGDMYNEGQGVEMNHEVAVEWFRKAAALGDSLARYNLGMAYIKGLGLEKCEKVGIALLRKSAECGDEDAKQVLNELGLLNITT